MVVRFLALQKMVEEKKAEAEKMNMKVTQDPTALDLVHQVLLSWRQKKIEMVSKYRTSNVRVHFLFPTSVSRKAGDKECAYLVGDKVLYLEGFCSTGGGGGQEEQRTDSAAR